MNTTNGYIEMYSKQNKNNVRVYSFATIDNKPMALIFNPNAIINPWSYVKVSSLMPLEYAYAVQGDAYVSKTKRNKAKGRMKILEATWQTSDGNTWSHENIEDAIAYELELMAKEKETVQND
jgi:hypothetical protein